jgi:dTDP-4-dehydrorhamnose reductase
MLGSDLCETLTHDHDLRGVDIEDFDIADATATRVAVTDWRPGMVVHCAAWTDVDGCERDPERAFVHNARGAWNVASACAEVHASMVYISTDFVFDGERREPYTEFDQPNPLSVYGASKLAGELAVRSLLPTHYVVRTAWLFGKRGRSFVRTILEAAEKRKELRVVADQLGSPTYTRDLAKAISDLIVSGRLLPTPGYAHGRSWQQRRCGWPAATPVWCQSRPRNGPARPAARPIPRFARDGSSSRACLRSGPGRKRLLDSFGKTYDGGDCGLPPDAESADHRVPHARQPGGAGAPHPALLAGD